ncbi:MAG: DivIVA domain-containing protein [Deltaproteobacteria bacterium]|nr:DivIVA domain-containing protein [Deltaproteobacteria bacterium]
MGITPIEIQQRHFKNRLMGYDKGAVDRFLEEVATEMARLHRENQELKENLARNRASMEEMREREAVLKETLITTQKMTDDLKLNARKEADLILREGRIKAEKIIRSAEEKRFLILDEINELHRQKAAFQTALGSLLEHHRRILELEASPGKNGVLDFQLSPQEEVILVDALDEITEPGSWPRERPREK